MGVTLSINDIKSVTSEMARYDNLDYTGHSFSFLKRRLNHVFSQLKVKKLSQFTDRLDEESFREGIRYHMSVNVTEMFRDPGFWRSLRHNVLPLFNDKTWSVWFPDTPSGEEVFSLIILLLEAGKLEQAKILCSHPSLARCKEIEEGILDPKNADLNLNNYRRLEEQDKFEDYFLEGPGSWKFRQEFLKNTRFVPHSTEEMRNEEFFDLIMFRNSGINYTAQFLEPLMRKLVDQLNPGGFIALGVKESLPVSLEPLFAPVDKKESIYRKLG